MQEGKVVFYFGGGNTRSIYGSGIVKGIADRMSREELFAKTREFIVGSGGAVNIMGLVAGQADIPGRVCMEDLQNGFVSYSGALNRIFRGFARKIGSTIEVNDAPNCVNINHLMSALRRRRIDYEETKKCPVPVWIKLFDIREMRMEYTDMRQDPERLLRQGVSIVPYFTSGDDKVDGEALEPLGVDYMLSRMQPKDKLVVVINYPPINGTKHSLKSWLERMVADEVYPGIGEVIARKDEKFRREVDKIRQLEREGKALFIYPDESDPTRSRTTNPKILGITKNLGYADAEKIITFVRNHNINT